MALAAMGASSRPPDGASSRPPDQRGHPTPAASTGTSPTTPRSSGTPTWVGARPASGEYSNSRSYDQIIADSSSSSSPVLLEINLYKVYDHDKHYDKLKSFPALGKSPPTITLDPNETDRENLTDDDDDDKEGEVEKTTATNGTKEPEVTGVSLTKLQQNEKTQKTSTEPPPQQEKHTDNSKSSLETDPMTENPDNLPERLQETEQIMTISQLPQ